MASEAIQQQIAFLSSSTANTVHRWRRDHIAYLLEMYLADIAFKDQLSKKDQLTTVELTAVRQQLNDERANIARSAAKFEEELKKAEAELADLKVKAVKLSTIVQLMIRFVKSNRQAFFGFLAENGLVITWADFLVFLDSLDVPMLLDLVPALQNLNLGTQ